MKNTSSPVNDVGINQKTMTQLLSNMDNLTTTVEKLKDNYKTVSTLSSLDLVISPKDSLQDIVEESHIVYVQVFRILWKLHEKSPLNNNNLLVVVT